MGRRKPLPGYLPYLDGGAFNFFGGGFWIASLVDNCHIFKGIIQSKLRGLISQMKIKGFIWLADIVDKIDGVVKSPISALRCIPRHCDVR